nr:MAG TPA: hypothetical protein [Bacteriophage sp.]
MIIISKIISYKILGHVVYTCPIFMNLLYCIYLLPTVVYW